MHNDIIKLPPSDNPRVPEAAFDFRHIEPVQLRFNDFDMLGHLNNSVYIQLLDLGKVSYFEAVMPGITRALKDVGVVVANIDVNFYAPTYISDNVSVVSTVVACSERSFTLEQRVMSVETGEVKCMAHTVMVGIDMATGHSAPIPLSWIEAFERFECRGII